MGISVQGVGDEFLTPTRGHHGKKEGGLCVCVGMLPPSQPDP